MKKITSVDQIRMAYKEKFDPSAALADKAKKKKTRALDAKKAQEQMEPGLEEDGETAAQEASEQGEDATTEEKNVDNDKKARLPPSARAKKNKAMLGMLKSKVAG